MKKEVILNKLYDKLDLYKELKIKIGFDEEKLTKPDDMSQEFYLTNVVSKLPRISERKLFNNAYLAECIKKVETKIKEIEES